MKWPAGVAFRGAVDAVGCRTGMGLNAGNTDSTQALINAPGEDGG
jgi:hypothetical protein